MSGEPGSEIAKRDEMLQLLFWLEGEGFPGSVTQLQIARFLTWSEPEVARVLVRLESRGDIARESASSECALTESGRKEAGRRFAEEFSPLLAQGHGECNDPDCDCHSSPDGLAECHAHNH